MRFGLKAREQIHRWAECWLLDVEMWINGRAFAEKRLYKAGMRGGGCRVEGKHTRERYTGTESERARRERMVTAAVLISSRLK